MKGDISGYAYDDEHTRKGISEVMEKYHYIIDPHGAVGYLAAREYQADAPRADDHIVILETAHPAKFIGVVENTLETKVEIPDRLAKLSKLDKEAIPMSTEYTDFKEWLSANY